MNNLTLGDEEKKKKLIFYDSFLFIKSHQNYFFSFLSIFIFFAIVCKLKKDISVTPTRL